MNQENTWSAKGIPEGTMFYIPHYQRGYRWGEKEVSLLLDDLSEFVKSGTDTYCLQPLVFKRQENGNKYRVVDGQQRLTTIWLLMSVLGMCPQWTICYEYMDGTPCIVVPEAEDGKSKDINKAFRWEAYHAMQEWLKEHGEPTINNLRNLLEGTTGKQIVFIKYFVQHDEDEHDVFDRLNNRKIPLTSAELIRALFMTSPISDNAKMEIAKEWELIEDSLRDPILWQLFVPVRDKTIFPARIGLLFQALSTVTADELKRDVLAVFHEMEKSYNNQGEKEQKEKFIEEQWQKVLECFWWMRDCQENVKLRNFLGWLAQCSNHSLKTIYQWWQEDKVCFEKELRQKVARCLQDNDKTPLADFSDWRYGHDKLKEFLLLLNVLHCNAQDPPVLFRFDAYRAEKGWDIEHIHSQTYKPLDDLSEKEKEELLKIALVGLSPEARQEIAERDTFSAKIDFLNKHFQSEETSFDLDGPANLALLDLSTNRAYKNAWFPVKRRWFIQEAERGRFIPPCTFNAFMKIYNPAPRTLAEWETSDCLAYGKSMKKLYDDFRENVER